MNSPLDQYAKVTASITEPHVLVREVLRLAGKYFSGCERSLKVVDLGAGAGRDALYYLENGCEVIVVEKEQVMVEALVSRVKADCSERLVVSQVPFEEMVLPDEVDIVSASLSLPFVPYAKFNDVWQKVVDSLREGGFFAGHFFGNEHGWFDLENGSYFSEEQLLELFRRSSMSIIDMTEINEPRESVEGEIVKCHMWDVILQKQIL